MLEHLLLCLHVHVFSEAVEFFESTFVQVTFRHMKTLSAQIRRQIIGSLAKVKHDSIAGYSIQKFVRESADKTDSEVIQCISEIKSQAVDNRTAVKNILGKQFRFIMDLNIPAKYAGKVFTPMSGTCSRV